MKREDVLKLVAAAGVVCFILSPFGQNLNRFVGAFPIPLTKSPWDILVGPVNFLIFLGVALSLVWLGIAAVDRLKAKASRPSQSALSANDSGKTADS